MSVPIVQYLLKGYTLISYELINICPLTWFLDYTLAGATNNQQIIRALEQEVHRYEPRTMLNTERRIKETQKRKLQVPLVTRERKP